ncbi:MAG: hypothetical protein AAFY57_09270 [Cyanobacteria bacterium J06642_2]
MQTIRAITHEALSNRVFTAQHERAISTLLIRHQYTADDLLRLSDLMDALQSDRVRVQTHRTTLSRLFDSWVVARTLH